MCIQFEFNQLHHLGHLLQRRFRRSLPNPDRFKRRRLHRYCELPKRSVCSKHGLPPLLQSVSNTPFHPNFDTNQTIILDCSAYTTCTQCTTSNQDSCGWCLSTRTCQLTTQAGCADLNQGSCPLISSVNPPSAFKGDAPTLAISGGTFTNNNPSAWEVRRSFLNGYFN